MANTPILNIPLLSNNQAAKETTINDAINFLEKASNDWVTLDFTAGDITLPQLDLQRYFWFRSANVSGVRHLNLPAGQKRVFAFDNSAGSNKVTLKQGTFEIDCLTGEVYVVAATGSTLKFLYNSVTGGSISFPQLTDVPHDYTDKGGFLLKVKTTEDGLEFSDPASGGLTFRDLAETPDSYTGKGKFLTRVNQAENALEFIDPTTVINVIKLISQDTTARTLSLGDLGAYIRTTNVGATQITVPTNALAAFPLGAQIHIRQSGTGLVEIVAAAGVTINTPSTLFSAGLGATVTLVKVGTDEWDIFGALQPL
ncbi:putative minor tail protein [Mesorhizobium phage Cp1R7A-A1]|nr:putative minor tail protein [Mesorhizobium phage Cp1R7A-A1]